MKYLWKLVNVILRVTHQESCVAVQQADVSQGQFITLLHRHNSVLLMPDLTSDTRAHLFCMWQWPNCYIVLAMVSDESGLTLFHTGNYKTGQLLALLHHVRPNWHDTVAAIIDAGHNTDAHVETNPNTSCLTARDTFLSYLKGYNPKLANKYRLTALEDSLNTS